MPDQFKEVTRRGYGGRIGQSFKAAILGFLLFIASFFVLYINEGRTDFSKVAKTAQEISADQRTTDPALQGRLVSVTGLLGTPDLVGDKLFLKPGPFLAVERTVEMYGWVEHQRTETRRETGGSETRTTTYEYEKEWVEKPEPPSAFKHPEGHENPGKQFESATVRASTATVGVYQLDLGSLDLPEVVSQRLTQEQVTLDHGAILQSDEYVLVGKGTLTTPQVGDLRIQYGVVPSGISATVFGKLAGETIASYVDENDNELYRALRGTREQAIKTLRTEYTTTLWILRLVGLAMMWIGLFLMLGPIGVILDILPILGSLGRGAIMLLTFPVALVLSLITIVVSQLAHNPLMLVVVVAITAAVIVLVLRKVKPKPGGVSA